VRYHWGAPGEVMPGYSKGRKREEDTKREWGKEEEW
jgi:hypothetical protein